MMLLDDNLKMTNTAKITTNEVQNMKVCELDNLLLNIPKGYKKAIVDAVKFIAASKDRKAIKIRKLDLADFITQVIWMNKQAEVMEKLNV